MEKMYEHQEDFLAQRVDRTALVWSCGTGKTRTACEWSKQDRGTALVICPKSLKKNWQRERKRWGANMIIMSKEEFKKQTMLGMVIKH